MSPALAPPHFQSEVAQRVGLLPVLGVLGAGYFGYQVYQWYMNWSRLPRTAFARNDRSLTPVTVPEITTLLQAAHVDGVLPLGMRDNLLTLAADLIGRGALLWTGRGAPHAEVIVENHDPVAGTYQINLVVVIPRTTNPQMLLLPDTRMLERGQAIHELVHALEVVTKIGGPQNLGQQVVEVQENGRTLLGRELQWSRIPEQQSTVHLTRLSTLLKSELRTIRGVQHGYYLDRLNYGLANRHEFPTVINQIVHDVTALGDLARIGNTQFYAELIQIRDAIRNADNLG